MELRDHPEEVDLEPWKSERLGFDDPIRLYTGCVNVLSMFISKYKVLRLSYLTQILKLGMIPVRSYGEIWVRRFGSVWPSNIVAQLGIIRGVVITWSS